MTTYSTDCISMFTTGNTSFIPAIRACQANGTTPFCWPPNGTRICMPYPTITFFWPPSYYGSNANITVTADLDANFYPYKNDGNRSYLLYSTTWDKFAREIPGTKTEKLLPIYMRVRNETGGKVLTVDGPTVVLVQTRDWPSPTSYSYIRPTKTPSTSSKNSPNSDHHIAPGAVAGIVLGSLVILICSLWCCACCCCKINDPQAKANISDEERARITAEGANLMHQSGRRDELKGASHAQPWALSGNRRATEAEVAGMQDHRPPPFEEVYEVPSRRAEQEEIRRAEAVHLLGGEQRQNVAELPPKYTP